MGVNKIIFMVISNSYFTTVMLNLFNLAFYFPPKRSVLRSTSVAVSVNLQKKKKALSPFKNCEIFSLPGCISSVGGDILLYLENVC